MACGIDIGTGTIISARQDANAQIQIKSIRDAFLKVDNEISIKTMLNMSNVNVIEGKDDTLYILGEPAVTMSALLKQQPSRPMSKGVLSPGEDEADRILQILIENVLGSALVKGETCFFSMPGDPIEREMDTIYHKNKLEVILSKMGYDPHPLNEAAAIAFSNASKEQFSALTISAGAGMLNVCLMYKTMIGLAYSIINSGDWIDDSVGKCMGISSSRACFLKEKGVNLLAPSEGDQKFLREREAIAIYYKSLILRLLDSLREQFIKRKRADFQLPEAVPLIIAGGTSMAKNFVEFFKSVFDTIKDKFPIPISEIRGPNGSPIYSVAQGLLVAALNHDASKQK